MSSLSAHPDYARHPDRAVLPEERLVFRWHAERSYSAQVFYSAAYIRRIWGRILAIRDVFPALPFFQDVVVLQKT